MVGLRATASKERLTYVPLVAALSALLAMLVGHTICPLLFAENDDTGIQLILSGATSGGAPSPYAVFINYLLGLAISGLFSLAPSVAWWTLFQLALIWASMTLFGVCMGLALHEFKSLPLKRPVLLAVVLALVDFGLFLSPLAWIQFTETASVATSVATFALVTVALLPTHPLREERFVRLMVRSSQVAAIALFVLGFAVRSESALASVPFLVLGLAFAWVRKREVLPSLVPILVLLVCCSVLSIVHELAYATGEWAGFQEVNNARSAFLDYPHPGFGEARELYESAGWSEEVYNLASSWYFLDDAITPESFEQIASRLESSALLGEPLQWAKAVLTAGSGDVYANDYISYFSLVVLLFAINVALGRDWLSVGVASLAVLGLAAGLSLLCAGGRFLFRVFFVMVFPAVLFLLAIALADTFPALIKWGCGRHGAQVRTVLGFVSALCYLVAAIAIRGAGMRLLVFALPIAALAAGQVGQHAGRPFVGLGVLLMCLVVPGVGSSLLINGAAPVPLSRFDYDARLAQQYAICEENPEKAFVFTVDTSFDPWLVDFPNNAVSFGGWSYFAPWHADEVEDLGLGVSSLTSEDFVRRGDRLRLLCFDETYPSLISALLSERYGAHVSYVLDSGCSRSDVLCFRFRLDDS